MPFEDYISCDLREDICQNPNVRKKHILKNPTFDWDWSLLIQCSPDIDYEFIEKYYPLLKDTFWDYYSSNRSLTFNFILDNLDKNWDWGSLSNHDNITMDDIKSHPELPWDNYHILENSNITIEDAEHFNKTKNPKVYFYYYKFSMKEYLFYAKINKYNFERYISRKELIDNSNLKINLDNLEGNKNIDIEFLYNYLKEKKYQYMDEISGNENMTFEFYINHPDIKNDKAIFRNPNVDINELIKMKNQFQNIFLNPKIFELKEIPKSKKYRTRVQISTNYLYYNYYFTSRNHHKNLIDIFMKCEKLMIAKCCHPCRDVMIEEFAN